MAETYGFFDSENHDRVYNALQLSRYFEGIVTNGVFDKVHNNLIPYVDAGLLKISSGRAIVDNHWYDNDDDLIISTPSTSTSVMCMLVLVCDYHLRKVYIDIRIGTSESLPDVSDSKNLKFLKMAELLISSTNVEITKLLIGTDECPLISDLSALKNYCAESVSELNRNKVDKQTGKSLSTNDFTDDYKSQIDTNRSDISELKTKTDTANSDISALTVEVGEKAASADVYTKAQADSRITEKVSEIVAGAPEEFNTLREMSDWLLQHAESAAAMNTAITKNASDILALAEATEAEKLGIASRNYIPVRYVSGNKDFNIDFQISAEGPAKVIFANLQKSTSANAPFPMSETRSYIVSAERLYSSGDLEYVLKLTCVSVQFAGTEYAKVYEHQRFYIKSSSTYWTDWEECGKTADDTILEKIAELKNDIAVNKSTLGYRIKNLFDVFSVNWSQPSKTTVAEDGTVTTTVTSDPRQFIYSNSDAFVTLGAGTYKIIVNTTDFVSGTYAQINGRDSDNNSIFLLPTSSAGIHKTTFTLSQRTTVGMVIKPYSQTFTLMICHGDFEDESYVPYTNTSVDERFRKFESQPLLYSSTSTEESPLMINIPRLFGNYSAVICQLYTSNYTDKFNLTLPLKYIKSLGTGSYYSAESQLLFEYVDDDNLCIRTGMGQSNPTMSGVKIIALY